MYQHTLTNTVASSEDLVLTHGVELHDCPGCSYPLIEGERCPRGCEPAAHRPGTRIAARARFHLSRLGDALDQEPTGDVGDADAFAYLADGGSVRAELVA